MALTPAQREGLKKGRCTAAVKDMRVQTVYKLLADGLSNEQIIQFASENWDVGRRQTENYVEKQGDFSRRIVRSPARPTLRRCSIG